MAFQNVCFCFFFACLHVASGLHLVADAFSDAGRSGELSWVCCRETFFK